MVRDSEQEIIESSEDVSVMVVTKKQGDVRKVFAVIFSGFSVIAVLPIPYLVIRSVSYLITKNSDLTFSQIMHSDSVVFWIFGPATAILGFLGVAPFNLYNSYKYVYGASSTNMPILHKVGYYLFRGILVISGSYVGYNMNLAFKDVVNPDSVIGDIINYLMVAFATVFAGISDSRVALTYLKNEISRDYRFFKRGAVYAKNKTKEVLGLSDDRVTETTPLLTKSEFLLRIRYKLDDLYQTVRLGLTSKHIQSFMNMTEDKIGISTAFAVSNIKALSNDPFPSFRYFGSEILGTAISGLFSYFANQNLLTYAYEATSDCLKLYHVSSRSWLIPTLAYPVSWITFGIGTMATFYLIRDLFFREIFKNNNDINLPDVIKRGILPLIPALSFSLINVILTILNPSLSAASKVFVAVAAVMSTAALSRYGIDGGIQEILGYEDLRKKMANSIDDMMNQFEQLESYELKEIWDALDMLTNEILEPESKNIDHTGFRVQKNAM